MCSAKETASGFADPHGPCAWLPPRPSLMRQRCTSKDPGVRPSHEAKAEEAVSTLKRMSENTVREFERNDVSSCIDRTMVKPK